MDKSLAVQFTDTLALLFYHTLPNMSQTFVKGHWQKIGFFDDIETCLSVGSAHDMAIPSTEQVELIKSLEPQLIVQMIKEGLLVDDYMDSVGIIAGNPIVNPDGKGMKSQRCVLLSSKKVQEQALQRLMSKKQKVVIREEKKQEKESKANDLVIEKPAHVNRRKGSTSNAITKLRAESTVARQTGNNEEDETKCCSTCSLVYSVMTANPEYGTALYSCHKCDKFICNMCIKQRADFTSNHVSICVPRRSSRRLNAGVNRHLDD